MSNRKAFSISILNQIVSSGTNFALGLYLIRALTPFEFGLYGIGFAIVLLYAGIGNALLLTQMVVHVPDKLPEDKLPYATRILIILILFCAFSILVSCLLIEIAATYILSLHNYAGIGIAITFASSAYLIKDFFVRHAYTIRTEKLALAISTSITVTLTAIIVVQYQFYPISHATDVLWSYAASNFTGALVGLFLTRLPIKNIRANKLLEDAREAWIGGRWALGGVSVSWLQGQAYMYITAIFIGPAGVGYANAAKVFITPAQVLMPAITQVIMPRLAALRTSNPEKMLHLYKLFFIMATSFSIIYSGILLCLLDFITPLLIGSRYKNIGPLVAAWCLALVCQFSNAGSSVYLQANKDFKILTLANMISFTVAIITAIILMQIIGVHGSIIGTASGDLIMSILLFWIIKKKQL